MLSTKMVRKRGDYRYSRRKAEVDKAKRERAWTGQSSHETGSQIESALMHDIDSAGQACERFPDFASQAHSTNITFFFVRSTTIHSHDGLTTPNPTLRLRPRPPPPLRPQPSHNSPLHRLPHRQRSPPRRPRPNLRPSPNQPTPHRVPHPALPRRRPAHQAPGPHDATTAGETRAEGEGEDEMG